MDRLEVFTRLANKTITKTEALALLRNLAAEAPTAPSQEPAAANDALAAAIESVRACVAGVLHLDSTEIADELSFSEMGVDSISGLEIVRDLNLRHDLNLDSTVLYDFPHVADLAQRIVAESPAVLVADRPAAGVGSAPSSTPGQQRVEALPAAATPTTGVTPGQPQPVASAARVRVHDGAVRTQIEQIVSDVLHLDPADLDPQLTFQEMGFDSISGLELVRDCNTRFGLNLDSVVIYDHADLDRLSAHIASLMDATPAAVAQPAAAPAATANQFEGEELKAVYHDAHYSDLRRKFLQDSHGRNTARPAPTPDRGGERPRPAVTLRMTGDSAPASTPDADGGSPRAGRAGAANESRSAAADAEDGSHRPAEPNRTGHAPSMPASDRAGGAGQPPTIAVIGMAGVFPDAADVDGFWDNLVQGVTSMRPVPPGRWGNRDGEQHYDQTIRPALLDDIESFDPLFFNISPIDAEVMDPQQRIFLEVAQHAFEDAGYPEDQLSAQRVGVYVGAATGDYQKRFEGQQIGNSSQLFAGNASSILPARISYFLDLRGPCLVVDTACSSSLVAVHQACQALRTGEVDMALAGGVRLMVTDELYVQSNNAGMISPTGQCRAFDEHADGIALGEAAGAVILKRLDEALADGDRIYGVILGSGVNQDGHTNGITAPSSRAQAELEVEVYQQYQIDPRQISLIEAHGTGTALGDPIEVKALRTAFAQFTDETDFCDLGSVKNNVGHTTMAAGIVSLIKVLKAMEHQTIPPLPNFEHLNPKIDLAGGPFRIQVDAHAWTPPPGVPRTAALSSFGFSGTNCHLVIQEAPVGATKW